jgi:hypothetical protein
MIKLEIKKDAEKVKQLVQLLKHAAGSGETATKAREAIAAFVGPVITQALDQEATHRAFFEKYTYTLGSAPSIPLDYFDSNTEGLFDVWSTSIAGGLATNTPVGGDEFRLTTFRLDSALSMLKKQAEEGRYESLVKSIERLAQEVLVKEKFQAWCVILGALAGARTNGSPQLISATTSNVLQVDDLNRLNTKVKRFRNSWIGGTPSATVGRGITHYVISPEIREQLNSWAYQPMNTRPGSITTSGATAIALPDQIRMSIFNGSGLPEIPGIGAFIELNEFGVGQSYNSLFDSGYTAGVGEPAFNGASDELVLGVDLSVPAGVQVIASDSDRTTEFVMEEDDQFTKRSGKFGYFGGLETGFAWMDVKTLSGIIV